MKTRSYAAYILVGILNTAFGYSMFALFIFLKLHYSLAVFFSTVLGIVFNFKTIGRLVFKSSDNSLIFRFFAVYAVTYLINVAGLKILSIINIDMYIAGAVLLLPMAVVSFIFHKGFVFREPRKVSADALN
jgi:putative flippase GtrA